MIHLQNHNKLQNVFRATYDIDGRRHTSILTDDEIQGFGHVILLLEKAEWTPQAVKVDKIDLVAMATDRQAGYIKGMYEFIVKQTGVAPQVFGLTSLQVRRAETLTRSDASRVIEAIKPQYDQLKETARRPRVYLAFRPDFDTDELGFFDERF